MTRHLTILSLLLLLCLPALAQRTDQFATGVRGADGRAWTPPGWSSSILWWKFDGTDTNSIQDYSVSGTNTGFQMTVSNAPSRSILQYGYMFPETRFSLASNNTTVSYAQNIGASTPSNKTMAIWVSTLRGANSTYYCAGTTNSSAIVQASSAVYSNFFLSGSSSTYVITNYTLDAWHRLVEVFSNGIAYVYCDGVLATSGVYNALNGISPSAGSALANARPDGSYSRILQGFIDDFYITSYLYTPSDVSSDYLHGRSVSDNPTYSYYPPGWSQSVLWWRFDSSETNVIRDSSPRQIGVGFLGTSGTGGTYAFTSNSLYIQSSDANTRYYRPTSYQRYLPLTSPSIWTMATWINPAYLTNNSCAGIIRRAIGSGAGPGLYQHNWNTTSNELVINWPANDNLVISCLSLSITNAGMIATNQWYRYALACDGSQLYCYTNGVLLTNFTPNAMIPMPTLAQQWTAGYYYSVSWWPSPLSIDDVYLTQYCWTEADASNDFVAGRSQ